MRAAPLALAALLAASVPGAPAYAAAAGIVRALPGGSAPFNGAAAVRLAPRSLSLGAPSASPLSGTLVGASPLLLSPALKAEALSAPAMAAPASAPTTVGAPLAVAAPSAAPGDAPRPGGLLERLEAVKAPPTLRERLAAARAEGREVEFDGAAARCCAAEPAAAASRDAAPPRLAPSAPAAAAPARKTLYYLSGETTGETRFGPAGYLVHFGLLKGLTIFLKTKLLFLVGGLPAVAVYLALLPIKIPAFVRVQSMVDHTFARPLAGSISGALARRGWAVPGAKPPLNPRDELVLAPGVGAVVPGQRSEARPHGWLSLGGSVVNRMTHRFRFLVAAERPLSGEDAALARAGGVEPVDGEARVRLSAHRGAEDLGVTWSMSVAELLAGKPMDRDTAARLRKAAGGHWLRDTAARALLYVAAAAAVGFLFHPLHLHVAVGVTVFILLELEHKAHGLALWRKHLGSGAERALPLAARWKAFRTEAWAQTLEQRALRIDAVVDVPGGTAELGSIAAGLGALRMAGAGLRQQARALELPTLFIGLAAALSAVSAFSLFGLQPEHAVLGLVFFALAAGMAGGVRALWRAAMGRRGPAEKGRPVGASRFVKQKPKTPWVSLGAAGITGAALLSGMAWPLVALVGGLAALVAVLDLQKHLTGVARTPGGGYGGWVWELLDLLLTP